MGKHFRRARFQPARKVVLCAVSACLAIALPSVGASAVSHHLDAARSPAAATEPESCANDSGSDASVTCGFPDASNTGVPAGTDLSPYTGPMKLASGTIDSVIMYGDFTATGPVTIKNSKIYGTLHSSTGTLTLTDDEVIGSNLDQMYSVIYGQNIIATRINVHGGKANLQCVDHGCVLKDSYLHDPWLIGRYHYDMVGSNGVDGMTLDHNTLQCQFAGGSGTGGCSANLGFFGDFAPITNVTINDNLFMASTDAAYCVITNASKEGKDYPAGSNLRWTNNVFQRGPNGKCGYYGAVDDWESGNGNVWTGNTYDDGTPLNRW